MRLRCRFGIHDWNVWNLDLVDNLYYTQSTTCKCCGIHRVRKALQYTDRS